MKPTNSVLRAHNGGAISCFGTCTHEVKLGNATAIVPFVVKNGRQVLLRLQASEALGLVERSVCPVDKTARDKLLKRFRHLKDLVVCNRHTGWS